MELDLIRCPDCDGVIERDELNKLCAPIRVQHDPEVGTTVSATFTFGVWTWHSFSCPVVVEAERCWASDLEQIRTAPDGFEIRRPATGAELIALAAGLGVEPMTCWDYSETRVWAYFNRALVVGCAILNDQVATQSSREVHHG